MVYDPVVSTAHWGSSCALAVAWKLAREVCFDNDTIFRAPWPLPCYTDERASFTWHHDAYEPVRTAPRNDVPVGNHPRFYDTDLRIFPAIRSGGRRNYGMYPKEESRTLGPDGAVFDQILIKAAPNSSYVSDITTSYRDRNEVVN